MLIDPNNRNEIHNLGRGTIAFPNIPYLVNQPLNVLRPTLNAAYTIISDRVDEAFLQGLDWFEHNGDANHQNEALNILSIRIGELINEYHHNNNPFLLTKIFIWIQLWGGVAGRNIFVRDGGLDQNLNLKNYLDAILQIQNGNYNDALITLNTTNHFSTAFSTKHINFWSSHEAPIFDSIISSIVFGRASPRQVDYQPYINALNTLLIEIGNPELTISDIERNLFNWANTPVGRTWIDIRLHNP